MITRILLIPLFVGVLSAMSGCYVEPSPPQNRVDYQYERQTETSAPGQYEKRIDKEERTIQSGGNTAEREQLRQDFERKKRQMQDSQFGR